MTENNMELWDSVCETDPKNTKAVKYGKREFTAIDAYSQIKQATELWGPYGGKWGLAGLEITELSGSQLLISGVFKYPDGQFPVANNIVLGMDSVKKLVTNTISKALSMLGFNTDVFLGRYEDDMYVEEMRKKNTDFITLDQQTEIDGLIVETGSGEKDLLAWLEVASVKDIPADRYKEIIAAFDKKKKAMA